MLGVYIFIMALCLVTVFKFFLSEMKLLLLFLLISICMEYLFPAPHFHSVCIPGSQVGFL